MGVFGICSAMDVAMMDLPMGESGVTVVSGWFSYSRVMPPPAGRRRNWWSWWSEERMTMEPRMAVSGSSMRVMLRIFRMLSWMVRAWLVWASAR